MLHPLLEGAFDDLLAARNPYDEAKSGGAPVEVLAAARDRLESVRSRMSALRRALHPEEAEVGEAVFATHCRRLDASVAVYRNDISVDSFRCACGDWVPLLVEGARA